MTLIDILTIVACLIAGAFTIRLGNQTLRRQRIEKKRQQRREAIAEEGEEDTAKKALRDLEIWRKQGYLEATEASWEQLWKRASKDPELALQLQGIVAHHVELTERQSRKRKSVLAVSIKMADEDSKELKRNFESARERKPRDTLMVQAPLLTHR